MQHPAWAAALAFPLTGAIAIAATRLVLGWLRARQILDHPNERSSHTLPTPRGGGLAVMAVTLVAWAALGLAGAAPPGLAAVLAAALGLVSLGWRDDRGHVPAGLRFSAHLLAAGLAVALLPAEQRVTQGLLPLWADRTFALLALGWFLNLYNFMDGIDGITGVETATLGLGVALLGLLAGSPDLAAGAPLGAAVAAAACGFLVWNWHPARIFLGDSGSVPLGYLLGWLLLTTAAAGDWAAALILPAYYLTDATLTLLRRALRGEKVWQAHRQHFYQRAVQGGASHAQVSGRILLANAALVGLALASHQHPWPALAAAALVVMALLAELSRLAKGGQR